MRSAFRIPPPTTLKKLSTPSHQLTHSPFRKRAPFAAVPADASNSPADQDIPSDQPPPAATCYLQEAEPLTTDTPERPPLLSRPLPVCDIDNDTENNSTVTAYPPSSSFPVLGPFDLLHCIQIGGFGAAWAAQDRTTGRVLCLKIFQSLENPEIARSVQTELRVFRRMVKAKAGERGRQFIMELSRSIQHGATVFFAMELMTADLGTYMSTRSERCNLHARRWTAQIALGIESLHEMGILHRDIKSENILIDSRENVRIIDFGLCYMDPHGEPLRQGADYATDFLGTQQYMAPEVLRNNGRPTHRRRRYGTAVDWWALGCIIFELESRDHQPLFNTDRDVHAYIDWTQRACQVEGEMYSRFEGLDPVVVDLVEGLLEVKASLRYALNDLEKHDYFLLRSGSEFDDTAARAFERPVCPELVPRFTSLFGLFAEAATLSSIYDWKNLKWAHLMDEKTKL